MIDSIGSPHPHAISLIVTLPLSSLSCRRVVASEEFCLIGALLHDFTQVGEVVVVIDPEKQLGQVWSALMVILEVG